MKNTYSLLAFGLLFGLFSCQIENEGIREVELRLETEYFDKIKLEASANIRIIQSDVHEVIIQGFENDVYEVDVNVIGDQLSIEEHGAHPADFIIKIYVDEISRLENAGSSIVYGESHFIQNRNVDFAQTGSGEIDFALTTDDIDVEIRGSGYVYLEGDSESLDAEIDGSGWLRSFGLNSDIADVRIEGSGSAEVNVSADLDAFILGSGDIHYKGHPAIFAEITGSGRLIDAN
jgi:hypothetical protein